MAGRCYATLVRVFPPELVRRYGAEMTEAFERELMEVRARRGRRHATSFVARAWADAIRAGLGERRRCRARWYAGSGEDVRSPVRRLAWMEHVMQDLRLAARMLARQPGFAALVVLTLALGIGVNTALFSIVNGVLLRPLPYPDPDAIVRIHTQRGGRGFGGISEPEFVDLVGGTTAFEAIGLMQGVGLNLTEGEGDPEYIDGLLITAGVFDALGVRPALGRPLHEREGLVGGGRAALISDGLWKRRFGADASVLGRSLRILNETYEIVGVMPAGFAFPDAQTEAWIGYGLDTANLRGRGAHFCAIVARLREGVTRNRAQADVDALSARVREANQDVYRPGSGFHFVVQSYLDDITGAVRPALVLLMAAVGLVLLIACANVASLLLARAADRGREFAVRAALGAGRARILRQLLTESLFFGALAGLLAIPVAWWVFGALAALHPGSLPRMGDVRLDTPVLLFNAALVALATLTVGGWPALWVSGALRPGRGPGAAGLLAARTADSGGRSRGRAVLVVAEVALAAVLLVGAGLVVRSLERLADAQPGFTAEHVLTARVTLAPERYPDEEARAGFYRRLMDGLATEPDVVSAAAVNYVPASGVDMDWYLGAEGYVPASPNIDFVQYRTVTPGYFETLGIPILRGRDFTDDDRAGSQPVAILSAALAKRFWGDQDPIGRRVRPSGADSSSPWHVVVGIAGDIQYAGPRGGDAPIWYRSTYQDAWSTMSLVLQTGGDPARAVRAVKGAVAQIDPRQPVYQIRAMTDLARDILSPDRLNANLLALFAALALALAAIGIYGVLACEVGQRTHEIGVRVALGARGGQVLRDIVAKGLTLVVAGLGLGLAGALALSRLLRSLLFGIDAYDPATFTGVAVVLLGVGLLACVLPARRALRVDPLTALRQE